MTSSDWLFCPPTVQNSKEFSLQEHASLKYTFLSPFSTDQYHYSSRASVPERKTISSVSWYSLQERPWGPWKCWSPLPAWKCSAKLMDTLSCGRIVQIEGWASAWCLRIISQERLAVALNQQITSKSFPRHPNVSALLAAIQLSPSRAAGMGVCKKGHLYDISKSSPDRH